MEVIEKKFGDLLKKLRNDKSLSQEQLAFESGLDRTYISLIERGQRNPTLTTLFKISNALEIKTSELIKLLEIEN
jgi:transcriptional regulator with XRE-family HTH domain